MNWIEKLLWKECDLRGEELKRVSLLFMAEMEKVMPKVKLATPYCNKTEDYFEGWNECLAEVRKAFGLKG